MSRELAEKLEARLGDLERRGFALYNDCSATRRALRQQIQQYELKNEKLRKRILHIKNVTESLRKKCKQFALSLLSSESKEPENKMELSSVSFDENPKTKTLQLRHANSLDNPKFQRFMAIMSNQVREKYEEHLSQSIIAGQSNNETTKTV